MSLLVFFALFGVFLTQYVPLWMTDNEAAFTGLAQQAMAQLKANIDFQVLTGNPPVMATPFVMSSQGIPLIAQPTAGILNFIPNTPGVYANVSLNPGPGGGGAFYQNMSLGVLQFILPNRYFSQQLFNYQDDAVAQSQSVSQQIVEFPPLLSINQTGTNASVTMMLLQLFGNATQTVSVGTAEVYSHFLYAQSFQSSSVSGTATAKFRLGTSYPCGWGSFLNTTLTQSGLPKAKWSVVDNSCGRPGAQMLSLSFTGLSAFKLILGEESLVLGVGVE